MPNYSINKAFQQISKDLSDRQKEVILGRFGLDKGGKVETLEALGKRFGVTRERVRQIEASALQSLKEKIYADDLFVGLIEEGKRILAEAGGVLKKDSLLNSLKNSYSDLTENHLALVLAATKEFFSSEADKEFHSFYYLDKGSLKNATTFISQWVSTLKSKKDQAMGQDYEETLTNFIKAKKISVEQAQNFLEVSKKIHKNPFGEMGLSEWAEIKPKTIRDRIYVVLKKHGQPMHFQSIAAKINEVGFDAKPALASTVHNELIKDNRFVLVGRGVYGLSEHGYERGTAREVIQKVLLTKGPMRSKEIVAELQKERFFKYNTILVNLQNRNFFERRADGTYQVKES